MSRIWHKLVPPKVLHEQFGIYKGVWMPQMDRYWESEDGYNVMSRRIRTAWGPVEHVTIQKTGTFSCDGSSEVPWSVKQEIKDELFGKKCTAIEVFPERRNLVDVCDVYHLWVLPTDFKLPFGIHPIRDPQCEPIERGYDFDLAKCKEWNDSPERAALMGDKEERLDLETLNRVVGLLDGE